MIDLGAYKDKFSDSGQRILEHALNESRRRDQNYVAVEHILKALADEIKIAPLSRYYKNRRCLLFR